VKDFVSRQKETFLIKIKIPSELSIFRDNFGNSYFLEKEDKRGSMTSKESGKKTLPEKEDSLPLSLF
jgi:hypothetical protein